MSKIAELEVRVGVTKNIGNYESVRLDYVIREQFPEGVTDPAATLDDMRKEVAKLVKQDVNKILAE